MFMALFYPHCNNELPAGEPKFETAPTGMAAFWWLEPMRPSFSGPFGGLFLVIATPKE